MRKIKKGDLVQITKGKDRGKRGKVLAVLNNENTALVEGINLMKKHARQRRQEQQGGILSIEAPLNISNLAIYCKQCNKPARVGFSILKDGSHVRICRRCKGNI